MLGFIDWIQQARLRRWSTWLVLFVARSSASALAVGLAVGWLAVQAFQRVRLATAGLYPVASIATAALAFGAADVLHGSGFLAVYLAGLALGSAPIPARRTVTAFHEGLAWVAQLAMFLTLGLLVFPTQLGDVAVEGTLLALVLVLVARPVAALRRHAASPASTLRERALLGWAGLRGAVPVVLATFPVHRRTSPHSAGVLQHRLLRRAALDARCRARPSSRSRERWA